MTGRNQPFGKVPLRELVTIVEPGFACGEISADGVAQVRMNNITTDGQLDWSMVRRVPATPQQVQRYQLSDRDVLFNSTNSPQLVGKSALFRETGEPTVFSNHFLRIRPRADRLDGGYLVRWFNVLWIRRHFETRCAQWVNQAAFRKEDLLAIGVPLPPLTEQRRIAAILDKADAIRRKRQQALQLTDDLLRSTFLEMFGDPVTNPKGWPQLQIAEIGDVQGGLQVTSVRQRLPLVVPYLRVANVFRERLDLTEVKSIRVTPSELKRIALRAGDILLVEGHGNPEEIGRASTWGGSIEPCVHQNHLIRVRLDRTRVEPLFVSAFLNSVGGRRQLLGFGKTTSGLNTISTAQVKRLRVPMPPLGLQQTWTKLSGQSEITRQAVLGAIDEGTALFNALVQRAFRGEL